MSTTQLVRTQTLHHHHHLPLIHACNEVDTSSSGMGVHREGGVPGTSRLTPGETERYTVVRSTERNTPMNHQIPPERSSPEDDLEEDHGEDISYDDGQQFHWSDVDGSPQRQRIDIHNEKSSANNDSFPVRPLSGQKTYPSQHATNIASTSKSSSKPTPSDEELTRKDQQSFDNNSLSNHV